MNLKNKKKKQIVILTISILLVVFLSLFLIIYERIIDKKTMGCRISVYGLDISKLPIDQATQKIADEFQEMEVVFVENGSDVYKITLKDMGYSLDVTYLQSELADIKEQRDKKRRLIERKEDFKIKYDISVDEKQEAGALAISHFETTDRTAPKDAYIKYDENRGEFTIIKEVQGNQIDEIKLLDNVRKTLEKTFIQSLLDPTVKIEMDNQVYQEGVTSEGDELNNRLKELNQQLQQYRNTSITYMFGETAEVLDSERIRSWIVVNNDSISIDEEAVNSFISELGAKYNTIYMPRYFQTSYGSEIKINGNEYGYRIDKKAELQQLAEDLKSGTDVKRDPIYSKQGMSRNGKDDLAGSYIEVSLDNQYLWLYKNGTLVTETDIISGLPTKERQTYRGAWPIAYKASPFTLSSDIYGYDSDVTYWMPFVYGQGLHDADWQPSFGGELYKTKGSHGCINLPPGQAEIIYNSIQGGYPIIIY